MSVAGDYGVVAGSCPDAVVATAAEDDLAPSSNHDQVRPVCAQDDLDFRTTQNPNACVRSRPGECVTGATR